MMNEMDVEYDAKTRKVKITMTRRRAYDHRVTERRTYTMSRYMFDRALSRIEVTVPLPETMRTRVIVPGPTLAEDQLDAVRERIANSVHGDSYEGLDPAARKDVDTSISAMLAALIEGVATR